MRKTKARPLAGCPFLFVFEDIEPTFPKKTKRGCINITLLIRAGEKQVNTTGICRGPENIEIFKKAPMVTVQLSQLDEIFLLVQSKLGNARVHSC